MRLWTFFTSLAATAALCAFALTAQGGVSATKHNMNLAFGANTIQDNQVCLPCHAPHNQPSPTQGTLWNHVMPTNPYTLYAGTPIGGSVESATVTGLDEESLKCLSCHDGSVAVDQYGGYNFTTQTFGPTTTAGGKHVQDLDAAFQIGKLGDLSNDHPVGVTYPGLSTDGKTFTGTSFNNPLLFTSSGYTNVSGGTLVTYTSDGTTPIKTSGGGIKMGTNGVNSNIVGCGTCHTPHGDTYGFLAISNYGSQLCMTCHTR